MDAVDVDAIGVRGELIALGQVRCIAHAGDPRNWAGSASNGFRSTATDDTWLDERYDGLLEAYCSTLVRGIAPERLLRDLGAEPTMRVTGVEAPAEPS
ncbi:DUF6461 domain-containing protein [Streptomyces sp. HUAS TT20]|uniref:DUF6461 domain-containing protein n=1 Tax=Streptomyces sp. HUAS TT20 TaxID=3447509 RepID=UPI003986D149